MRCYETDGKILDLCFGQAVAGYIFDRIEISIGELRGMNDRQIWEYIYLRLLCRLAPGGTLTIVQGPLEEGMAKDDRMHKP